MKTIVGIAIFLLILPLHPGLRADTHREKYAASILKHGDIILAVTETGEIWRASVKEGTWSKMKTPAGMPKGGKIIQQSDASPLLVYYVRDDVLTDHGKQQGAIYVSKDAGAKWDLAAAGKNNFTEMFFHPDGSLYAFDWVEANPDWRPGDGYLFTFFRPATFHRPRMRLIVSRDLGKTWDVLTEHFSRDYNSYCGLRQDPDHPDQVCFQGEQEDGSAKAYDPMIFQAADKSYQWTMTRADKWHDGIVLHDYWREMFFLNTSYGALIYDSGGQETLDQILDYSYLQNSNYAYIGDVRVEIPKTSYSFHAGKAMVIPVKITALATADLAVTLLDNKDQAVFWGINVRRKGDYRGDAIDPMANGKTVTTKEKREEFLRDPGIRKSTLDDKHPYERTIDLSKLYDFSKPGVYEVQLMHTDDYVNESGGGCYSGVIELTVAP